MRAKAPLSRYTLLWPIAAFYLAPLVGMIAYSSLSRGVSSEWELWGAGLFLSSAGSLTLFWLLTKWEASFNETSRVDEEKPPSVDAPQVDQQELNQMRLALAEAQQTQAKLLDEIEIITQQGRQQNAQSEEARQRAEKAEYELTQLKASAYPQLEDQQSHIRELQAKIAEQASLLDKRQQHLGALESKVGDLTYEIKTLLQLAETHSSTLFSPEGQQEPKTSAPAKAEQKSTSAEEGPKASRSENRQVRTSQEASQQLKRCLDVAQRITGSQRFGSQLYMFSDSPADNFAIDLRRLCDRLRSEGSCAILLYSPKDGHLLFANNQIRQLTGWSPEKFAQNFQHLLANETQWKEGVGSLAMRSEAQIQLDLKNKSEETVSVQAHLGMIPSGIFRNHIIAVLFADAL